MPGRRRAAPWQVADHFAYGREATAYDAVLDACLAERGIARRLGMRPQATAENVRATMLTEANVGRALEPCRAHQERFRAALRRYESIRTRIDYLHDPVAPETVFLSLLSLGFLLVLAVAPWTVVAVVAIPPVVAGFAVRLNPVWRMHVRHNAGELALTSIRPVYEALADSRERAWRRELQANGAGPLMGRVVEALLGEDRDSLLLPDSYEGLRSPRNRQYVIGNEASQRLSRKMAQLEGGTIAVSGPRGAGKSTLLESCAEEADFAVVVQAPATYSPHEFLLSLYIEVCERYLTEQGHDLPEFARLTILRRIARQFAPTARRLARWLVFALPAGALVVLGLAAATRSVGLRYEDGARHRAQDLWADLTDTAQGVWGGERVGTALAVTVAGVLLWQLRRWQGWGALFGTLRLLATTVGGILLILAAPASLFFDTGVRHGAREMLDGAPLATLYLALVVFLLVGLEGRSRWTVGGVSLARRPVYGFLLVGALVLLYRTPPMYAMVTDTGNTLRVACVLLGLLLLKARTWTFPQPEPPLVTQCRNQLYRLQTVQTSSSAVTTGSPALVSAHTTSLSTVPPNFPTLVSDFRELLTSIARERFARKGRVVIAIDEVDRLGSDTQALAFLGEIKAILGVPHVHYLISVAEDVGASFIRRGLPHRGVTDSSLDDIVHVQPCTLKESKGILERRAPGLSEPYSLLAHALSGGIPRDLIRYGLRIMEIEDKTRFFELTDISRQMILEELAETLAGFRVLLAKQEWTSETSAVLLSFRNLMGHLRHVCPCPDGNLHRALHHIAFYDPDQHLGNAAGGLSDRARSLLQEASTYVLFSLTLLDVFGAPDFARRRAAAALRADGDPDILAQARHELEVSPYSARSLIMAIRTAWRVPHPSGQIVTAVPSPRTAPCSLHPQPAS
ncbi:hypothetical protein [Streptomyces cyanogenus]|uniref:Uncharacterized protein n=1 Tax=Streptomyces cyanogenus TaxID=80860 RepID=A0ABX7U188_STRCY|nr:hypothetical protein [Streptomyces cyanogenus]QTE01509.1 hypothetical protein S1361_29545 [Streptomyces cyanogenus]